MSVNYSPLSDPPFLVSWPLAQRRSHRLHPSHQGLDETKFNASSKLSLILRAFSKYLPYSRQGNKCTKKNKSVVTYFANLPKRQYCICEDKLRTFTRSLVFEQTEFSLELIINFRELWRYEILFSSQIYRDVRASVGAGFLYPLVGTMPTIPGLPTRYTAVYAHGVMESTSCKVRGYNSICYARFFYSHSVLFLFS